MSARLVVVGGGILGTMHAIEGMRLGYEVVQLERELAPRGASLRNFGLIWVSGRAPGRELELALKARERWEAIAADAAGTGFRPAGSLTLARSAEELAACELLADGPDADRRGVYMLEASEVRARCPAIGGELLGALCCARDAVVEPRLAVGALRDSLARRAGYRFCPGTEVREVGAHSVVDQRGDRYEGDLVVCCTGASSGGAIGDALRGAPLRRVRLQMLETEPFAGALDAAVADGDSLRYYPAFAASRERLAPQDALAAAWRAQLLMVRRLTGKLTIGDTHAYEEPFPFDLDDAPSGHLLKVASTLLGTTLPPVARRWAGVYCESTDPDAVYFRKEIEPGVFVVTGPGGRGMTLSPAIAAESFA